MPADLLVKKLDGAIACCPTVEGMALSHVIFPVLLLQFLYLFISAEETAIFTFHAKGQGFPVLILHEVFAPLIEFCIPVGSIENHPRIAISKFPFDDVFGLLIDRQHELFGDKFKFFIKLTIVFFIGILFLMIVILLPIVFSILPLMLIFDFIIQMLSIILIIVILPVLVVKLIIVIMVLLVSFLVRLRF